MKRRQFTKHLFLAALGTAFFSGCGSGIQPGLGGLWSGSDGTGSSSTLTGQVVFVNSISGRYQLYLASADGKTVTRLTNGNWHDYRPSFSADGKKILFASTRDGADGQLYVMNHDGTGATRLTSGRWADSGPSFSSDGKKIVFESNRDTEGTPQLYVMNADGSGVKRLTNDTFQDYNPSFSPDGKYIVYMSARTEGYQLFRMDSDGANTTLLVAAAGNSSDPRWAN